MVTNLNHEGYVVQAYDLADVYAKWKHKTESGEINLAPGEEMTAVETSFL